MSDVKVQQQTHKYQSQHSAAGAESGARGHKVLTFALLLTVPVALTGCNTGGQYDCDDYDDNNYCDDDGTFISSSKKTKKSSSYKSSSSSSKGFGSSGISGSSGG